LTLSKRQTSGRIFSRKESGFKDLGSRDWQGELVMGAYGLHWNNFFIELIRSSPLVLMRQSGADFVLNAFGVAFITTLDDLGPDDDRRKLTVITGDDTRRDSEEALME
jgi:hypothetical protein